MHRNSVTENNDDTRLFSADTKTRQMYKISID